MHKEVESFPTAPALGEKQACKAQEAGAGHTVKTAADLSSV